MQILVQLLRCANGLCDRVCQKAQNVYTRGTKRKKGVRDPLFLPVLLSPSYHVIAMIQPGH